MADHSGFLARELNAEVVVTVPRLTGSIHMHLPDDVTEAGGKLLTAAMQRWSVRSSMAADTLHAGDVVGLVGSAGCKLVSALSLQSMVGRVAVWPCAVIDPTVTGECVAVVLDHPDTLLMTRDRVRTDAFVQDVGLMARIARGEANVVDVVGRGGCVVCADKHQQHNENVTGMTRQGLAVCRAHGGWDVRPKDQRWVEERMF